MTCTGRQVGASIQNSGACQDQYELLPTFKRSENENRHSSSSVSTLLSRIAFMSR